MSHWGLEEDSGTQQWILKKTLIVVARLVSIISVSATRMAWHLHSSWSSHTPYSPLSGSKTSNVPEPGWRLKWRGGSESGPELRYCKDNNPMPIRDRCLPSIPPCKMPTRLGPFAPTSLSPRDSVRLDSPLQSSTSSSRPLFVSDIGAASSVSRVPWMFGRNQPGDSANIRLSMPRLRYLTDSFPSDFRGIIC